MNSRFQQINLIPIAAIVGTFGLALYLGSTAGAGNFTQIAKFVALIGLGIYFLFLYKYTWQMVMLVFALSLNYAPFGFNLASVDITTALAGLLFLASCWQKSKLTKLPIFEHFTFKFMNTMLILWVLYALAQFTYNVIDPYSVGDFGLKNLLKTYLMWTAPPAILLYFLNRPTFIPVSSRFPITLAWFILVGLLFNIAIRVFFSATNLVGSDASDSLQEGDFALSMFRIPIIGAYENVFALRSLGPFSVLFGSAFCFLGWYRGKKKNKVRLLFYALIFFGILGSLLSGGRATALFAFGFLGITFLAQRRVGPLVAMGAGGLLLIAVLNLVAPSLHNAPLMVQRSMQWALLEKDTNVSQTIAGSSDWRYDVFWMALKEWQSEPRVFWVGRGTFSYGLDDVVARATDADGPAETALRRGATHNMLSDLLLIFGLIGTIIYLICFLSIIRWCLYAYKKMEPGSATRNMALVCTLRVGFTFVYGLIGGGTIENLGVWLMIILVARLYQESEGDPMDADFKAGTPQLSREPAASRFGLPRYPGG